MSVARVCVGCQRGLGLFASAREEFIDPRWQRLFRTLRPIRHISYFRRTQSGLSQPPSPYNDSHSHNNTAARPLSTSTPITPSAILPASASEWRAIRSGHIAEPLTAIVITGAAASTWLQGLITADMSAIDRHHFGYTAALNFKGRVVFTAFVHKPHSEQSTYHLLLPTSVTEAAVTHLGKLNFRRKVSITTQPTTLNHILPAAASSSAAASSYLPDPRTPLLGSLTVSTHPPPPPPLYHPLVFDLVRHLHCIPSPGCPELAIDRSLPLDCSLDHLHAIAFNKGCYMGQEVTARAHYTGTIRKRLYSAFLTEHNKAANRTLRRLSHYRAGEGVVDYSFIDFDVQLASAAGGGEEEGGGVVGVMAGGKEVGKLYSSCFNVAMVQLRIESVERGDRLSVTVGGVEWEVVPYELDWWPMDEQQQSEDDKGTVFLRNQPVQ